MKGLTPKQKKILSFLQIYLRNHAMAPTVQEIAEYFGNKTPTIFEQLKSMERKSFIRRSSKARSIVLLSSENHPQKEEIEKKSETDVPEMIPIKLQGFPPDPANGETRSIQVDHHFFREIRNGTTKMIGFPAPDQSMRKHGIVMGDLILTEESTGNAATEELRVLILADGKLKIRLVRETPEGILMTDDHETILLPYPYKKLRYSGPVRGIIRQYGSDPFRI